MKYTVKQKVYVKSNNYVYKIMNKYRISLIIYIFGTIIINYIIGNSKLSFLFIKSIILSILIVSFLGYIISILKKKYNFWDIYIRDNLDLIALVIGIFGINNNVYILLIALIISLIIKNINNNINISASLYGIIFIIIYKYFNNNYMLLVQSKNILNILFGIEYFNPVLSLFMFFYLFFNKAIKYNLFFSFIFTIFIIMLLFGIFNSLDIFYGFVEILKYGIIFFGIYILTDFGVSPITSSGSVVYGIILGIIFSVLRFINSELAIFISLLFGQLILNSVINSVSLKFKNNHRFYDFTIILLVIIIIVVSINLSLYI